MENRLKKQLAQIKARALTIAGRAQGEAGHYEIVEAVLRTGAVVRGADFNPTAASRRFPWWWRRRLVRERERGFEGEFQRYLDELATGDPVALETAVPGEPCGTVDERFYLIRSSGPEVDPGASREAGRFAAFQAWPSDVIRTRIGARPVYGVRDHASLDEPSPSSVLFLDIETAGLSANTYMFLCGMMHWSGGEFRVEQAFARDYTEEAGLLRHVRSTMERFETVVTYNGASFDLPFIRTRMAVHRIPDVEPMDSVDLLYPARRVFRPILPNCRLVTVERHLRGVERADDIPSRFIPRAYHEFVHSKDARIMRNVVYHNRMDVFTMALILNHLCEVSGAAGAAFPPSGRAASVAVEVAVPAGAEKAFAPTSAGDTIPGPNPPREPF